ncbi:Fic family protein [Thioalkalivibrio sp. HK1]|uniref:Fic family protein n=1 Tax=Thioalkalivibrio sp. HK1 TaxID=1469245 RepID=UPI0004713AB8|nr:Fic family protein [Thioalkalivibrio sp. HK1]
MKIPEHPPDFQDLFARAKSSKGDLDEIIRLARPTDGKGRYLHWDRMRRLSPPKGLDHRQWWLGTAIARLAIARRLPLTDTEGKPFRFGYIDRMQQSLHRIDQQAGGELMIDHPLVGDIVGRRYLVSSLIAEEAITSSLLEGAATTRQEARELLRSERRPNNHGERMVFNNYQAMIRAKELIDEPLTPDGVLSLHRSIVDDTLEHAEHAGRLQRKGEKRVAVYYRDRVVHRPPPASELPRRLEALCSFANEESGEGFIHPVVRAIVLHFQAAYDHYFVDGNGRLARALFYWSMLRKGYWLSEYISISRILLRAPARYAKSYLYVETDNNDLIYFILHQLDAIEKALDDLRDYLAHKAERAKRIEEMMAGGAILNPRQISIVGDLLRNMSLPMTVKDHARSKSIALQTARTDLESMESSGLLSRRRVGKRFVFTAVPDFADRLRALPQNPGRRRSSAAI